MMKAASSRINRFPTVPSKIVASLQRHVSRKMMKMSESRNDEKNLQLCSLERKKKPQIPLKQGSPSFLNPLIQTTAK
jgi:hypothetical protein